MAVDIATLSALPLPQLIAVSVVVVLLAAIVARVLSNTFNGKAPPIDEGIPFVGGLIKFSKVSFSTSQSHHRFIRSSLPELNKF